MFVLDRSGSMSGGRIEMAKQALVLFLKSLPPDCFFNVIGFGEPKFEKMFQQSQKYDENSLNQVF